MTNATDHGKIREKNTKGIQKNDAQRDRSMSLILKARFAMCKFALSLTKDFFIIRSEKTKLQAKYRKQKDYGSILLVITS